MGYLQLQKQVDKLEKRVKQLEESTPFRHAGVNFEDMKEVLEMIEGDFCTVTVEDKDYDGELIVDRVGIWVGGQYLNRNLISCFEMCVVGDNSNWIIHYYETPKLASEDIKLRGGMLVDISAEE